MGHVKIGVLIQGFQWRFNLMNTHIECGAATSILHMGAASDKVHLLCIMEQLTRALPSELVSPRAVFFMP